MEKDMTFKEMFDELAAIHKEYFLVDHLFGKDKINPLYRRGTLLNRKKLMKIASILGWDSTAKVSDKPLRFDKSVNGQVMRKASAIEQLLIEVVDEGVRLLDDEWWDSLVSAAMDQGISDKTMELLKMIGDKDSTMFRTSIYTGLITGMLAVYLHSERENKSLMSHQHEYNNLEFLNLVNGAFLCLLGEVLSKDRDGALFQEHFKQLKSWVDKSKNMPLEKIYSRARGFYYILRLRKDFTVSAANVHLSIFENFDGSGFPTGVSGTDIHEFARISRVGYEIALWIINKKPEEGKRELLANLLKNSYKDRKGNLKNKIFDQDIVNIALNLLK